MSKKKFIVYLTVNTVNRKVYVGVHKTDPTEFDGYIGNDVWHWTHKKLESPSTPFRAAVKKYEYSKFERITLGIFDNAEDAYFQESVIVTHEFVQRKDTYNVALGGYATCGNSTKVVQYTLDGKFLKVWETLLSAAEFYNKKSTNTITNACSGKYKTAIGFQWRYWMEDFHKIIPPADPGRSEPIVQYELNGELVKVWKSANSAGKAFDCKGEVLKRKTQTLNPHCGFQWRKYSTNPPTKIDELIDPKIIVQLTLDYEMVKEWKNEGEARKAGYNNLSKALNAGRKVRNYIWMYKKDFIKLDCDIVRVIDNQ